MNKSVLVGAAVGVVVLGLGGALFVYQSAAPGEAGAPALSRPGVSAPGAAAPQAAQAPGGASVPGEPLWRAAGQAESAPARAPAVAPPPPLAPGRSGAPSITEIQQRLQRIAASGQPNLRELDGVLADLQRNQGSTVVAGVNLQVVRDNLARTEHIQQLAQQMQALAANPTPETPARLQALMSEMQRTQGQMQALGMPAAKGTP